MRLRSFLLVAVTLISSATAFGGSDTRFWIGATGGLSTYSLSDLNDEIRTINSLSSLKMNEIKSGLAYGVGAGICVDNKWWLETHYERLNGSSEMGDATGRLEYHVPANAYFFNAIYTLSSNSPLRIGFCGGVGIVSAAGMISISITGTGSASGDTSGTGPLAQGFLAADIPAGSRVSFCPLAGYRFAKISKIEVRGETVYTNDGSKYSMEYSGLILRLGIKVFLN